MNTHYNTGADEFVAGADEFVAFSLGGFLRSVLMPSVLTNYVCVHVRISVQVLVEAHAVE